MDKNALLYYQRAAALKLSTSIIKHIAGFEILLGDRRYFFRGSDTPFNYGSSISVTNNKFCMNQLLDKAGFPVPKATAYDRNIFKNDPIESLIEGFSFPLVVKPMKDSSLGEDVICNITDTEQLKKHMKDRYRRHEFLSIEEFHSGLNSYRVLIFYNQVIGVVQRFPASVVGDGIHTINELITITNKEREKFKDTVSLGPIKVDEEYLIRLKELNLTLDSIPKDQETIVLCYTCNSTRGGTMKSLGKHIGKENADLLCRAAKALNINFVGFDVLCDDILIPFKQSRGVIIEANNQPDITIHENPMMGTRNFVSKKILRRLILRHPLSYLRGLYHNKSTGFAIKLSLLMSCILLTYKLV